MEGVTGGRDYIRLLAQVLAFSFRRLPPSAFSPPNASSHVQCFLRRGTPGWEEEAYCHRWRRRCGIGEYRIAVVLTSNGLSETNMISHAPPPWHSIRRNLKSQSSNVWPSVVVKRSP